MGADALDLTSILEIVQEIASRRRRQLLSVAERAKTVHERRTFLELAGHQRIEAQRLVFAGVQERDKAPVRSGFDDPHVTTLLSFFIERDAHEHGEHDTTTHQDTLRDTVTRIQDAIIFYRGLKTHTCDRAARVLLDAVIQRERSHLLAVNKRLTSSRRARFVDSTCTAAT